MFADPWFVLSGMSHGALPGLGEIIPFLSRVVGPEEGDLDPTPRHPDHSNAFRDHAAYTSGWYFQVI